MSERAPGRSPVRRLLLAASSGSPSSRRPAEQRADARRGCRRDEVDASDLAAGAHAERHRAPTPSPTTSRRRRPRRPRSSSRHRSPGCWSAPRSPAASDRGHDRRPLAGPPPVGLHRGVGRLAGAGRGRHPALHDHLPGEPSRGGRSRPQRPRLLHRLGRRVECRLRPRRWLAPGPVDPQGEGQRPARLQRRRVPACPFLPGSRTATRRTTSTPTASGSMRWPPTSGRPISASRSGPSGRTRRSRAAGRRQDHLPLPVPARSATTTTGRRTRTSGPSASRSRRTPRPSSGWRRRTWWSCSCASGRSTTAADKHRLEAERRAGAWPGSRRTVGRSRAPGARRR